jgi:hypothetical protein
LSAVRGELLKRSNFIAIESFLVFSASTIVLPWFLIDATTVPKFAFVGIYAFFLLRFYFPNLSIGSEGILKSVNEVWPIFLFATFILLSFRFSNSFWTQQIFGAYGRNTGISLYIFLSVIAVRFAWERDESVFRRSLNCFLWTGFCVNLYYIAQYFNLDFASWENSYETPSSFLGNPNFVSSYSGLALGFGIATLTDKNSIFSRGLISRFPAYRQEFFTVLVSLSSLFVLTTNGSAQGLIVAAIVPGVYYFFITVLNIRTIIKRFLGRKSTAYIFPLILSGLVTSFILTLANTWGTLLSRYDLQIRFSYWRTAARIVREYPFGVGLDSLGDYYLEFRASDDLAINSFVNAAHNVPLDLFVGGGVFLFFSYVILVTFTFYRSILSIVEKRGTNRVELLTFACWIALLAQSLISINQISLALWSFVFMGILLSFSKRSKASMELLETHFKKNTRRNSEPKVKSFSAATSTLGLIALFVAILPLRSDFAFRESLYSQNLSIIENSARAFPTNTSRLNFAAETLCLNGDPEGALRLTKFAVSLNSRDMFSWRLLLSLPGDSEEHRKVSLRLQVLDPKNPAWRFDQTALTGSRTCKVPS